MVLILTTLILTIIFIVGWIASIKIKNASIVDAMWALSLGIPVFIYTNSHHGSSLRNLILMAMALTWSLRLGIHLTKRTHSHHPQEDPRYRILREQWQPNANRNFLIIFLVNAMLVLSLSLPFYFSSQFTAPIQLLEWVGLAIFLIGFLGESIADHQLGLFRKKQGGGKICELGLWNHSRHPNYFFEAVIWIGIYLFCASSPNGVFTVHAPLIIIFLLTKVTGIPPTERSLLKSRGDAYREYQRTTSAFIPWFKTK